MSINDKKKSSFIQRKTRTVTTNLDGSKTEVITYNAKKRESKDKYFMIFEGATELMGLMPSSKAMPVMIELAMMSEYNTGVVYMTPRRRVELRKKAGVSATNLSRVLGYLEGYGAIDRKGQDISINPHLFWRGDTPARRELLDSLEVKCESEPIEDAITQARGEGLE